jgi:transposase InsO family protein
MKKGSISLRCALLQISRDTYYQFPKRKEQRIQRDECVVQELRRLAEAKKWKLGIRTLTMAYNRKHKKEGLVMNHKKVERIKREYGIPTKIRTKRFKRPEQPKRPDDVRIPANIVARNFGIPTPFRFVGTDVTYLWCPKIGRFVYASLARDFATGEYLGWSLSLHNDQVLVDATLHDIEERHGAKIWNSLVYHMDRGGTYTPPHFQNDMLRARGITPSMSRKGNCIDNAPTESGHGHLKDWLDLAHCTSLAEVEMVLNSVIHYFNEERPQWQRKKMTPVEYRNHLLANTT